MPCLSNQRLSIPSTYRKWRRWINASPIGSSFGGYSVLRVFKSKSRRLGGGPSRRGGVELGGVASVVITVSLRVALAMVSHDGATGGTGECSLDLESLACATLNLQSIRQHRMAEKVR